MAEMVSKKRKIRPVKASIGRQILDIITSGMYNNPMMVLREYIQNAADSIDELCSQRKFNADNCYIIVEVHGRDRTISVLDNGTGIPRQCVEQRLGNLGFSSKEGAYRRGFRGIGRLGGIGYCDLLRFETRSNSKEPVSVVEWDSRKLQSITQNKGNRHTLPNTIRRIARISTRAATKEDPIRFFKATMVHIHRFHTDILMNLKALRKYLSNSAPVPYSSDINVFQFGRELDEFLSQIPNYRSYNIYLNGEQIFKPYTHKVRVSSNRVDRIKEIKKLTFTNSETGDMIGLGWFAITSFRSSFPKSVLMRGIRVRHGNIEVGDEKFLDHIFTESRFATWHVGEIHLNHNIRPNARRDGFEESPDYESFLERVTFIGKGLSELCSSSSRERNAKHRAIIDLSHVEDMSKTSGLVIDEDHQRLLLDKSNERLESVLRLAETHKLDASLIERAKRLEKKIKKLQSNQSFLANQIDGRKVSHIPPKDLLQQICQQIVELHQGDQPIEKTLLKALKPYLK